MAVKKEACKNHPDKKTSRHCYHCSQPICSTCQQHHAHHLFCSIKCYVIWRVNRLVEFLLKKPELVILGSILLFSQFLFYLLISSSIGQLADALTDDHPVKQTAATVDTTDYIHSKIWIDSVRYQLKRSITIKIESDPNALYSVWNEGVFVDAVRGERDQTLDLQYPLNAGFNTFTIWRMDKGGKTALLDSFSIELASARLNWFSRSINRINTDQKLLALTFDGGSSDKGTAELLQVLDSLDVKCTVFLTGQFMKRFPDLVNKIYTDGHEVGNHSYSHPHLTTYEKNGLHQLLPNVNRSFLKYQLLKADSLYRHITGMEMAPLWRAPYGEINQEILQWAAELGYLHINWSKKGDSWDWVSDTASKLYRSNQQLLTHFLELEQERGLQGKIILMHLASERQGDKPFQILPKLYETFTMKGYRFTTVGNLLERSRQEYIYSKK